MKPVITALLFLVTLLVIWQDLSLYSKVESYPSDGLVHIDVLNNHTKGKMLWMNCSTRNFRTGPQWVPGMTSLYIDMPLNVFGGTVLDCIFSWPHSPAHRFNLFDENRDTCEKCSWTVMDRGACLVRVDTSPIYCFRWAEK